jgi:DNA-binding PadR family transcriptional regulator
MQTIEARSEGRWRPSPGSVYPTLAQLEDEGLIGASDVEGQKVFEITDAGRAAVAERQDAPAPWESDDDDEDSRRRLRELIGGLAAAAMQVQNAGDEQQIQRARELLIEARRGLYRILAEDTDE